MKSLNLRILSAALAMLFCAVSLFACGTPSAADGKETKADPAETTAVPVIDPDKPNLIAGEEKIEEDPFIYMEENLAAYLTLGEYKGLKATQEKAEVTDEEYLEQLNAMLEYYAEPTQITDRAAAEGDTCNFNYSGYIDGVQFEGGTAEGASITLTGNGGFIEGFVPAIIGKMPGSSFDIETTFPADYHAEDLAGKAATFKCTLNYIEGETIVPEFNDEFAKKIFGMESADVLAAELREALLLQKEADARSQVAADIWQQVIDNCTFHTLPEEKVTYIYQQFVVEYNMAGAIYYGVDYESYLQMQGITDEQVREDARNLVKDDLVFYSLVKAENVTLTDEEYQDGLAEYAEYYGYSTEDFVTQYGEETIRNSLLWNKVQEMLLESAEITVAE